ncbi:MAG: hypothetical protein JST39_20395, partial [Bacteroidetes bacterium]|nr:hypothetical protein [Bacteroidota bacterium]
IKIFLAGDADGRQADKKHQLEDMGYAAVFSFASPEACLRRLPLRPDLVLLPCPVKSPQGIELLRRIQAHNRQTMVMYVGDAPETGLAAAMRRAEKTCSYRRLKESIASKVKAVMGINLFGSR